MVGAWVPSLGVTGDTLHDVSGFGNDGALVNDPQWVIGDQGHALELDGVDQSVAIDGINASSNTWTCIVFADNTAVEGSSYRGLIGDSTDLNNGSMSIRNSNARQYLHSDAGTAYYQTWPAVADVLGYHMWTWQRLSDANAVFGKDLTFAQKTITGATFDWSTIDRLGSTGASEWQGSITAIYFYNRALTPNEIQQLYLDPLAPFRLRDRVFSYSTAEAVTESHWGLIFRSSIFGRM